ncbi:hypothetical protein DPMN_177528 [Dreissena polymorpha]|uniref:Uncharacterized protein n=1 Tax=Dreissena polymorpha TaxID=45954 RepID=A0A9D4EBU4_DREPO|nr:hypothetical protein DPMN_177528 [Dreissena polymorpha]
MLSDGGYTGFTLAKNSKFILHNPYNVNCPAPWWPCFSTNRNNFEEFSRSIITTNIEVKNVTSRFHGNQEINVSYKVFARKHVDDALRTNVCDQASTGVNRCSTGMNRGRPGTTGILREIIKMFNNSGSHRVGPATTGVAPGTTGTAPGTTGTQRRVPVVPGATPVVAGPTRNRVEIETRLDDQRTGPPYDARRTSDDARYDTRTMNPMMGARRAITVR